MKKGYNVSALFDALKETESGFHVSEGNSKLGKIAQFNILPIVTCTKKAACTCGSGGCYAVKNALCHGYEIEKNNCLKAWAENTNLVFHNVNDFEMLMDEYLERYKMNHRFFRIHSSGDFVNRAYAECWFRLAKKHSELKFLAFTKSWAVVRKVPFYTLDNFSLILSDWNGDNVPEDLKKYYPVAYCIEKGNDKPENALECPGHCDSCGMCWNLKDTGKDVFFHKH